jgi:hypothetical protein
MAKKILVLGVGQNNFLSFLYATLKRYDDSFTIKAPFIHDLKKEVNDQSWMYDNQDISVKTSLLNNISSFFISLLSLHVWQTFFFIFLVEKKFKKAVHFFLKHSQAKAFFLQNNNFATIDVFHFHYIQYSYLRELFLIPKNKKIVCTFWGSDLLRTSDILNFYFVKKALHRATTITCQSLEMREIILSKFGRNLLDKVTIAQFPVDRKIYDEMDANFEHCDKIQQFQKKYGYSTTKYNVLIGHNGSKQNNHNKIIHALQHSLSKDKCHLVVNLNYGISNADKQNYIVQLKKSLQESGFSFTINEVFFSKEELAISRLATSVFIHMPVSDALSGTMTEMLYANNTVITGSWLPYKTFKKMGLQYHEVDDFSELSKKLDDVMANFQHEQLQVVLNKKAIRDYFFNDNCSINWSKILTD